MHPTGMRQGQDVVEGRRSSQVNLEVQLVTNKAIYLSGTSTTYLLGTVLYLSRYILGVVGFCLLSWYLSFYLILFLPYLALGYMYYRGIYT